jgi:N-(2-amino-2-carboxyethyl)-L-glutamate synthase
LNLLADEVVKITERDETGGYLLNRIRYIEQFKSSGENCFNPNQYENPDNYLSYYHGLGEEISRNYHDLNYLFVSVSSGGTITGLSMKLKESFPNIQIIGVDVEGSLVFQDVAARRHISGIGSSKRSPIINAAKIDDVIILPESEIIEGCDRLLREQTIFGGASSGAVYSGARKYLKGIKSNKASALIVCPDKGIDYINTIYNMKWRADNIIRSLITSKENAILK